MKSHICNGRRSALKLSHVYNIIFIIWLKLKPPVNVLLNIEQVLLVIIRCFLIVWVLRQVIFVRQERSHAAKLQDALSAVHYLKLVNGQQIVTQFLIVKRVGLLPAPALAGVIGVDGFLAQGLVQILQRSRLRAAKEQAGIMR